MFQPDLLDGKRVLVTGGGSGLGREMARRYLQLGAHVWICGRRTSIGEVASELGAETGGHAHGITCDVRDGDAVEAMIDEVWRGGPLDILVNNAAGNFLARTHELSNRAVRTVIDIVLMGTLQTTLAVGRRWIAEKCPGVVVSIGTTYADTGSAYVVPSAAAKAGVNAMTRSLAVEWGRYGIRLNVIAPGPIRTEGAFSRLIPGQDIEQRMIERVPLGRFGSYADLENLTVFLSSDLSSFITGEVVNLDGARKLNGSGSFTFVGDQLTEEDWARLREARTKPAAA